MKKLISLLLCLLLMIPALATAQEEKQVNLLTWETYIDDETIAAFEAETGIKVNYSPMDSIEDMLLKLSQSGGKDYDLVLTSDYSLSILRKEGLLQKLDKSKLSGYQNLDENFLNQYYDPDNEYVIPYTAGTPLIVYDTSAVPFEITGYEDLWDERLKDSIATLDNPRVMIGIVLKTMGESFNTVDPEILNKAKEKMMPLYQNIRVFDDNTPYTALINGEATVAFMYSSQVMLALASRPELKVVYPKEGMGFGIDGLVIPVKAPHPENAHVFLDYLLRPEVAAHNAETQGYLNVNKAAVPYLSQAFTSNPALYIPSDILGNTEMIQDVGDKESLFLDIYTAFKLQ